MDICPTNRFLTIFWEFLLSIPQLRVRGGGLNGPLFETITASYAQLSRCEITTNAFMEIVQRQLETRNLATEAFYAYSDILLPAITSGAIDGFKWFLGAGGQGSCTICGSVSNLRFENNKRDSFCSKSCATKFWTSK